MFPCHSVDGGLCSCGDPACGSPGKHPRTWRGVRDASRDAAQIRDWWSRWPDASIGGAVGDAGLWVLDVDGPAGEAALGDWLDCRRLSLPPTCRTRTGGGGLHYWWRVDSRAPRNRVGLLRCVDVRSRGGYVVLPPSVHASGRRYELEADVPIAVAPAWLLDLVAPPPPPAPPPAHPRAWYPDGGAAVRLRDPGARLELALRLGGQVAEDHGSARGIRCPRCARASVWYPITPERWYGAACSHRQSCGWAGALTELG